MDNTVRILYLLGDIPELEHRDTAPLVPGALAEYQTGMLQDPPTGSNEQHCYPQVAQAHVSLVCAVLALATDPGAEAAPKAYSFPRN